MNKIFGSKMLEKDTEVDDFIGMNPECTKIND